MAIAVGQAYACPAPRAGPHLMMTHWFSMSIIMFLYILSARA